MMQDLKLKINESIKRLNGACVCFEFVRECGCCR